MQKTIQQALFLPVTALLTVCLAQNVAAEMYKWTDKDGKTHYTQTPPPANADGKNIADEIRLSTGKLGNTIPTAPTAPPSDEMEQARQAGEKSEQKHRDFCAQQEAALKQMTANSLIQWKDQGGEARYLTAEEKAQKMDELQKNIDSMCKPEMFRAKAAKPTSQTKTVQDALQEDNSPLQTTQQGKTADKTASNDTPNGTTVGATATSTLPAAD